MTPVAPKRRITLNLDVALETESDAPLSEITASIVNEIETMVPSVAVYMDGGEWAVAEVMRVACVRSSEQ